MSECRIGGSICSQLLSLSRCSPPHARHLDFQPAGVAVGAIDKAHCSDGCVGRPAHEPRSTQLARRWGAQPHCTGRCQAALTAANCPARSPLEHDSAPVTVGMEEAVVRREYFPAELGSLLVM